MPVKKTLVRHALFNEGSGVEYRMSQRCRLFIHHRPAKNRCLRSRPIIKADKCDPMHLSVIDSSAARRDKQDNSLVMVRRASRAMFLGLLSLMVTPVPVPATP